MCPFTRVPLWGCPIFDPQLCEVFDSRATFHFHSKPRDPDLSRKPSNTQQKQPFFPNQQEGVVRFYVGICVYDASTPRSHPVSRQSSSPVDPAEYPGRAGRQWIRRVSRQSGSPVDPAEYPARATRQWILPSIPPQQLASGSRQSSLPADPAEYRQSGSPVDLPSILPERLASGSRRVSRQSGSPADPAEYPARATRQWILPSIPPEQLASGSRPLSRQSCSPVDPAEYPARAACQWIPPSIPLSIPCQWIPPSIPPERFASQWIPPSPREARQCRAARHHESHLLISAVMELKMNLRRTYEV